MINCLEDLLERHRQRGWFSICWLIPQMAPAARSGQGQSTSWKLHLVFPFGFVTKTWAFMPSFAALPGIVTGSWMENSNQHWMLMSQEGEKKISTFWSFPKMATVARPELIQSQETRASSRPPTCVHCSKALSPPLFSQAVKKELLFKAVWEYLRI